MECTIVECRQGFFVWIPCQKKKLYQSDAAKEDHIISYEYTAFKAFN